MSHYSENRSNFSAELGPKNTSNQKEENIIFFQAAKDSRNLATQSSLALERLLLEAKKLRW